MSHSEPSLWSWVLERRVHEEGRMMAHIRKRHCSESFHERCTQAESVAINSFHSTSAEWKRANRRERERVAMNTCNEQLQCAGISCNQRFPLKISQIWLQRRGKECQHNNISSLLESYVMVFTGMRESPLRLWFMVSNIGTCSIDFFYHWLCTHTCG